MSAYDPIKDAFEEAKEDFFKSLKDPDVYDFSQFTSINDVYDTTDKIQQQQNRTGTLQGLNRIRPYLDCLSQYSGVIETFTQVKPDLLCLIWGPIKLCLQISSTLIKSFDKVVEVLAEVGQSLPQFQKYTELFKQNQHIKQVLCLFFRDILDFHATVLNFFRKNKWNIFFESLWPRSAKKISVIQSNMIRHKTLMNSEVTLENILQAYDSRERAYMEYDRMHDFQDWQNFEAVRAAIAPYLYDDDLEAFRRECQSESGQWLEEENSFKRWSDPGDQSIRLFWLQGMPGAGKTMTASFAICRKRAAGHNVLFAFPRHDKPANNYALKILHSLIFQVLLDNQSLQPIMHEAYSSNYRQIMSSFEFITELFANLVKASGTIFIVIDGVDEMAEIQRGILLKALTGQLKVCGNLKLLISSRRERDIELALGNDVLSARVDHKNMGDIEAYVKKQTEAWLPELRSYGADDLMCSEAKLLLGSISSKANGMFLYVILVMRNVRSQDNLYDIRNEIDQLPEGLDEAYARILARIEQRLSSKEHLMARKVMEWIGCANFAPTVEELLQALAITPGQADFLKGRKVFRDILKLCGPIIEIENDAFQFVHFTAKEYIFGKQSNELLNQIDGNLGIASVCLSYLSLECFDDVLSDEDIASNILSGDYVLLRYAANEWLEHIRRCAQYLRPELLQDLRDIISNFVEVRENSFQAGFENRRHADKKFQTFQQWPDIYEFLIRMDDFIWKERGGLLEQNTSTWLDQDPSMISSTMSKIRQQLEMTLCPSQEHARDCHCEKLHSLYGLRLFKCDRYCCQYYHIGFETDSDRDNHLKIHNRPFKCSVPNCEFADIGFLSNDDLMRHTSKTHHTPLSTVNIASKMPDDQFQELDLTELLLDAVKADEIEFVRSHYPKAKKLERWREYTLVSYVRAAASNASPTMVDFLLAEYALTDRPDIKEDALRSAINGRNIAVIQHLVAQGANVNPENNSIIKAALRTWDPEIIELLLSHGANLVEDPWLFTFSRGLTDEAEIIQAFDRMHKYVIGKVAFSNGYVYAADQNFIEVVKYFLDNGADVNYIKAGNTSVLYDLVRRFTRTKAELIILLLQKGANPYPSNSQRKTINTLSGMARLESYLGKSWEDLVREHKPMGHHDE